MGQLARRNMDRNFFRMKLGDPWFKFNMVQKTFTMGTSVNKKPLGLTVLL